MKHKHISVISLLLATVLVFTACGSKQEPTTSDPSASSAPIGTTAPDASETPDGSPAADPSPVDDVTPAAGSITPAVLTPNVTPGTGEPIVTPDASASVDDVTPTGTGTAAPTEGGTLQPASPAVSEAGNTTPVKGGSTPTSTPKPSSKKLLYAVWSTDVQDAPNYSTSKSLGMLVHGEQYEVLETVEAYGTTWYRIIFNGKNGYVPTSFLGAQYCSPTPTKTLKELAEMQGTGVVYTEVCPEMLTLVNDVRSELGLRLAMWGDKELEEIALARVVDTIEELENGCVHAGTVNYWHTGLDSNIGEIFAWGALFNCKEALNTWKNSPGHWASIISDCTEDEVAACDMTWWDGHEVKAGDIIPGEDAYMVCAHAIYQGDDYWVIVFAGKQRPWPND